MSKREIASLYFLGLISGAIAIFPGAYNAGKHEADRWYAQHPKAAELTPTHPAAAVYDGTHWEITNPGPSQLLDGLELIKKLSDLQVHVGEFAAKCSNLSAEMWEEKKCDQRKKAVVAERSKLIKEYEAIYHHPYTEKDQ